MSINENFHKEFYSDDRQALTTHHSIAVIQSMILIEGQDNNSITETVCLTISQGSSR